MTSVWNSDKQGSKCKFNLVFLSESCKIKKRTEKGSIHHVKRSDHDGSCIVLFEFITLQVELNRVRNQFTHYLLKPGSISKEQREYTKEPEMEAIRLIRLDYRIGLQNAKLVYNWRNKKEYRVYTRVSLFKKVVSFGKTLHLPIWS